MLLCGIKWWDESMKKRDVLDSRYLAKSTSSNISISITYIVFLTKLQKKANSEKGFSQIEKRYHNNFLWI
jgi:hypothetical protein